MCHRTNLIAQTLKFHLYDLEISMRDCMTLSSGQRFIEQCAFRHAALVITKRKNNISFRQTGRGCVHLDRMKLEGAME